VSSADHFHDVVTTMQPLSILIEPATHQEKQIEWAASAGRKRRKEFGDEREADSFHPSLADMNSEFNQISGTERDRRWRHIRHEMSRRGVDCLLLNGNSGRWNEMNANIRYVCGYADPLSGTCYALFPGSGEGTLVTQMTLKRSARRMSWFEDIRSASTENLPQIVEERLTQLDLAGGTLGLVGIIFRNDENIGLPWNLLDAIRKHLPRLKVVDVTELFFELRSVKSEAEIDCLEQSARLVDIGFEAHRSAWRSGITEREYYSAVVHAMDAAGAEPPTFLLLESGKLFGQWLTQDPIPSSRTLEPGDYIVSETSPKWAGYQAQGLQCVMLGKPTTEMTELVKYGTEIWNRCTAQLRPGNTLETVAHAADDVIAKARARFGPLAETLHLHVAYAGLGGPDPVARPSVIQPNQAFMPEIGPSGGRRAGPPPPWRMNGGYLVVSTRDKPRHFCGKYPIEERLLTALDV
jgi:Xaa-Pro aminopeptidase